MRKDHRPSNGETKIVETKLAVLDQVTLFINRREGIARISRIVAQEFIQISMQLVCARLQHDVENASTGPTILGGKSVGNGLKFRYCIRAGIDRYVLCKTRQVEVAVEIPRVGATLAAVH